jgi:spoIIIJ-associated protein
VSAIEAAGRTIDEAVQRALGEMGAARDDVEVEVLQEPKPALLGLGGREARVRVTRRPTEGPLAGRIAVEILDLMGYTAASEVQEQPGATTVVLEGQEIGGLIGRQGQTLDALEFLVGLHVGKKLGHRARVMLDAEGYRGRRESALQKVATEAAGRAARDGKPVFLEPMDPRDRRTIHLTLQDDDRVTTSSVGESDERRVVVHPRVPGIGLPQDDPAEDDSSSN